MRRQAFEPAYRKCIWAAAAAIAVAAACVLYKHDPMEAAWMPQCWWHSITGTDCPSCGTLRAVHAALHGNISDAVAWNPFLLVGVPVAAVVAWCECKGRYRLQQWAIAAYVIMYFAWWALRNMAA